MPTASSKSTTATEPQAQVRETPRLPRLFPAELFLLTDVTRAGLAALLADLEAHLAGPQPAPLHDLAFTVSRQFEPGRECVAIVASSHAELRAKLGRARERLLDAGCTSIDDRDGVYYRGRRLDGKMAFLFPGENAQYVNMLAELALSFPEIRRAFDEADAACAAAGDGFLPSALNFPPPGTEVAEDAPGEIAEWEKAVVLVYTANAGMTRLLEALAIHPDAVLGHSFGELSALEMAGVMCPGEGDDRIGFLRHAYLHLRELSQQRELPTGRLLAVGGAERSQVDALLARFPDALRVAMENCPHQYVLCAAGPEMDAVMAEAERSLSGEGAICAPLPIRRPYHTPFFEPAFPLEKAYYEATGVHPPRIEVYSCATAEIFPSQPEAIVEVAARHWMSCVRFQRTIETMYERGFRVFVDVGPRGNLAAFVGDILGGRPHLAVALNRPRRSETVQLLKGLGLLAANGVAMRVHHLHERWGSRVVELRGRAPGSPATSLSVRLATRLPGMNADGVLLGGAAATGAPAVALLAGARPLPVVPAPAASDGADPVLLAYMETMEQFLAAEGDILGALLAAETRGAAATTAGAPSAPPAADVLARRFPLLGSIAESVAGESLVARRVFDVGEDLYLRDHSLGTTLSRSDPALHALPVMPLVFSTELAAEAAAALCPGRKVVAQLDLRAHRFIFFDRGGVALRVSARRLAEAADGVHVRVVIQQETEGDAAGYPTMFESTVVLAGSYPTPPPPRTVPLSHSVAGSWEGASIYPRWTFHGPLFQGVRSVARLSEDGVDGMLQVLPRSRLLRGDTDPALQLDPLLLDFPGQAVWLWGSPEPFAGRAYLPYHVGAIRMNAPPLPPGTPLELRLRVRRTDPLTVVAGSEAIDARGQVVSALEDVTFREFQITPALSRLMLEPLDRSFADVEAFDVAAAGFPAADAGAQRVTLAVLAGFPHEVLEGSFGVWRKALAFLVLSPPEREEWLQLGVAARRESLWLLGRAAVKDALRHHFRATAGRSFAPVELMIGNDDTGRPLLRGGWKTELPAAPAISISHTDGMVVAAAAAVGDGDGVGIGVDTEAVRSPAPDLLDGGFCPAELERLPAGGSDLEARSEWVFRFWCAKEAVGKALGSGVLLDPRRLEIVSADPASGVVVVRTPAGGEARASTLRRGQHVLAVAAAPAGVTPNGGHSR